MRIAQRLRVRVVRAVARLAWPITRRLTTHREHRGFRLLSFLSPDEGMDEVAHARIALALDLIAAVDPRRFARIRRDIPNVRVVRAGGGYFAAATMTCVVDWPQVMRCPVVELAKTIVHEATHARLDHAGIGYPAEWWRRIERRCMIEEVAFLRRLPDDGAQAALREASIEPALASEWWLPHNAIRKVIAHARAERMPGWVVRWLERRQSRLARKATADPSPREPRRHDPASGA